MSGFDQLYRRTGFDLLSHGQTLLTMSKAINKFAEGSRAAVRTDVLIQMLSDVVQLADADHDLRQVWYAIEWWLSGDAGLEEVTAAIAKYQKIDYINDIVAPIFKEPADNTPKGLCAYCGSKLRINPPCRCPGCHALLIDYPSPFVTWGMLREYRLNNPSPTLQESERESVIAIDKMDPNQLIDDSEGAQHVRAEILESVRSHF